MFEPILKCTIWDMLDETPDEVLDRVVGETGVTGIALPVATADIDQLRPHDKARPRTFRTAGGVHFQPDPKYYAATRLRPVVADWIRKRNPLPDLAETIRSRGLGLRLDITGCYNPAAVHRNPETAAKNVFGDRDPHRLCPSNLDVRGYLSGMIEDLSANYQPDAVVVRHVGYPNHTHTPIPRTTRFDFGHTAHWMTRVCVCESCRQQAERDGLDIAAAERSIKVALERAFQHGKPVNASLPELMCEDPVLSALVDWRAEQITSLIARLRNASSARLVIRTDGCRFGGGNDAPAIANHADALLMRARSADPETFASELRRKSDVAGGPDRVEVEFDLCDPEFALSENLVRIMKQAADAGVPAATCDSYGEIPLALMDGIRRAARFARRTTGSS